MLTALLAAAIAGLVAVLVSLPLQSPDDLLFNSATVAIGAVLAGILGAVLWGITVKHVVPFVAALFVVFVAVALAAFVGESQLERTFEFTAPLAAIILGGIALLTPLLDRVSLPRWLGPVGALVVLGAGFAAAGLGDEESGRLSLPPTPTAVAASGRPAGPGATGTAPTVAGRTFRTPADVRGVAFVVGEGSEATFTVREKLANLPSSTDAVMRGKALSGNVRLDGQPSTVTLDLNQLSSDQSRRDNFVRRSLFNTRPTATFTFHDVGQLPAQYTPGEVVRRSVPGTLNIGSTTVPLTLEVEARLDGEQLFVLGRTQFTWSQLQLQPPNVAGVVQVEDNVRVEVLVAARAQPAS